MWDIPRAVVVIALAIGVATIIVVSAYGADARPAAYCGAAMTLAVLAWGAARQR